MGGTTSPAAAGSAPAAASTTAMSQNMQTFGMASSVFGTVSNTIGSFASVGLQKDALAFQSEVAQYNSRMAEIKKKYAVQAGQQQEISSRLNTANLKSKQRVALAEGNVELNSGTAARIQDTTDVMGELDAENIQANAIKSAWGYTAEAGNYNSQAAGYQAQASGLNAGMAGFTSLLGGATNVADRWYKMNSGKRSAVEAPTSNYLADSWK